MTDREKAEQIRNALTGLFATDMWESLSGHLVLQLRGDPEDFEPLVKHMLGTPPLVTDKEKEALEWAVVAAKDMGDFLVRYGYDPAGMRTAEETIKALLARLST